MITEHIPSIIVMVICLIFSAYFSATETAFLSMNKTRLKVLADKGNKKAKLALALDEKYDRLISTILIGDNIVNITLSSVATVVFVSLLANYGDASFGATVATAVVTVLVLIFGEITPKSLAKDAADPFAMFSAPIINFIMKLLLPLSFIFGLWKKLTDRIITTEEEEVMSQEELLTFLEEVEQDGGLDEEEGELLRNAVEFGDLAAKDILTHRMDLEAVSIDATTEEVAEAFTGSRFSRLLVYEDSIDRIVGVIHHKDFYHGLGVTDKPLSEIMSTPVLVHPTEKLDDLLRRLKAQKSHVSVVIDEYGGTLGIVTMEDILEELVGDIWDEHDEVEEPEFRSLDESHFTVDCTVSIEDFSEYFSVEIETESASLGGWVMEQLERIPEAQDSFEYENLVVTVLSMDERRVDRVSVEVREPVAASEE